MMSLEEKYLAEIKRYYDLMQRTNNVDDLDYYFFIVLELLNVAFRIGVLDYACVVYSIELVDKKHDLLLEVIRRRNESD